MATRAPRKASTPAPARRRGRTSPPTPERLSPGSKLPPGEVELHLQAVRAYKAGRPITVEQRGLVLQQLQRDVRVHLRTGPTWWTWESAWLPHEEVLRWARGEGWRVTELDAVLEHLALCGDVERRDGPSVGGLRSAEWREVRRG
jgi:hypothetical protein